jgi:hypothetical protein
MPSSPLNLLGVAPGSKIMDLPPLGGMTFSITNNAGWYDALVFPNPQDNSKPLDISGIDFHAELRSSAGDASNKLDISTLSTPKQFTVDGPAGTLYFSVDVTKVNHLTPGIYVMDILAIDTASGMVFNLCEAGPIQVTILQGITR